MVSLVEEDEVEEDDVEGDELRMSLHESDHGDQDELTMPNHRTSLVVQRSFKIRAAPSEENLSRPPDPGPTRLADPNRSLGRETIYTIYILYCTGTLIDLFFLKAILVPVVYKQFM